MWRGSGVLNRTVSREVERAPDAEGTGLEDVGIDHGGADVLVAEEGLDGADVVTGFEEMGGEAMAEGVATGVLEDAGGMDGPLDGLLEGGFGDVMSADDARRGLTARRPEGKRYCQPGCRSASGILLGEGMGEMNSSVALAEVGLMQGEDVLDLASERFDGGGGEEGGTVAADPCRRGR